VAGVLFDVAFIMWLLFFCGLLQKQSALDTDRTVYKKKGKLATLMHQTIRQCFEKFWLHSCRGCSVQRMPVMNNLGSICMG
jgi:hypothetical protein